MISDAVIKASNSERLRFEEYKATTELSDSSFPVQLISPKDLMLIANHIQESVPREIQKNLQEVGALNKDLEGILWLQIFGEYDLNKAENLWTAVAVSKTSDTETITSAAASSHSIARFQHEKPIDGPVYLTKVDLEQNIVRFSHLEEGWDSYEANKIDEVAIQRALDLVDSLFFSLRKRNVPEVSLFAAPMASGGIQIELDSPHVAVEIEIEPNETGKVSYYAQWSGKYIDNGYRGGPFVNTASIANLLFLT